MIKTFQVGLEWFPERAGGLPRYYYDLFRSSEKHFDFRGMLVGSERPAIDSGARVGSFASRSSGLVSKMLLSREAYKKTCLSGNYTPDLIVSHFAANTFPFLDKVRVPLVTHFHGPWAQEGEYENASQATVLAKGFVERVVYKRSQAAIVLSEAFADVLSSLFSFPRSNIHVVPGGVDYNRFAIGLSREEAKCRLGWDNSRPVVLCVRRLVRRMGLETLIRAMGIVVRKCPSALLYIAGRGVLHDSLSGMIAALGLGNNIKLLGFVSDADLPLAYRAASVSVVPTEALEGFGLIALESLAAGTPVIVTDVGGLPEIVRPFAADLVVEPNSVDVLADRILDVIVSSHSVSAVKCQDYASRFTWDKITPQITEIYKTLA